MNSQIEGIISERSEIKGKSKYGQIKESVFETLYKVEDRQFSFDNAVLYFYLNSVLDNL
jgi:hypothetical protein